MIRPRPHPLLDKLPGEGPSGGAPRAPRAAPPMAARAGQGEAARAALGWPIAQALGALASEAIATRRASLAALSGSDPMLADALGSKTEAMEQRMEDCSELIVDALAFFPQLATASHGLIREAAEAASALLSPAQDIDAGADMEPHREAYIRALARLDGKAKQEAGAPSLFPKLAVDAALSAARAHLLAKRQERGEIPGFPAAEGSSPWARRLDAMLTRSAISREGLDAARKAPPARLWEAASLLRAAPEMFPGLAHAKGALAKQADAAAAKMLGMAAAPDARAAPMEEPARGFLREMSAMSAAAWASGREDGPPPWPAEAETFDRRLDFTPENLAKWRKASRAQRAGRPATNTPRNDMAASKPAPKTTLSPQNEALFTAIVENDEAALSKAIAAKANVNLQEPTLSSPLVAAVHSGKVGIVKALLAAGADPNMIDEESSAPPLAFCITHGSSIEIAQALLSAGADPSWRMAGEATESTLARYAMAVERPDLAKLITEARAARSRGNINAARGQSPQPSASAQPAGKPAEPANVAEIATALGSGRLSEMCSALSKAASMSLARSGSDADWERLSRAAASGLAKAGASSEELGAAFAQADPKMTSAFRFEAEDPDFAGDDGQDYGTAFDIASAHGRMAELGFWAEACGPDWNPDGASTPLIWSIYGNRPAALDALLALGADPNGAAASVPEDASFESSADAPLHIALSNGRIDMALSLMRSGARASGTDRASLAQARASIDEQQRRSVIDGLGKLLESEQLPLAARAAGAFGALLAHGWTREQDFADFIPAARAASERFGSAFVPACQEELESISHLNIEFDAVLEARGAASTFSGSILDRAAATGQHCALEFLCLCAGPDWNPDGSDRPIDWAANVGDAKAVSMLAEAGATMDNADGVSPLPGAVIGGWREASLSLLEYGTDPAGLNATERDLAEAMFSEADYSMLAEAAISMVKQEDPDACFFGLRQIWQLAKVGWIPDWAEATSALDQIGFGPHLERTRSGNTQAGDSLLRESNYLMADTPEGYPLEGQMNYFSKMAYEGDVDACRFLARAFGPDFGHPEDNGSPLANAVAGRQIDTARLLISLGAKIDCKPSPIDLAALNGDTESFFMLASLGASPDGLSEKGLEAITPKLATKASQAALAALVSKLPADQDGFDSLLGEGSIPPSMMAAIVAAGKKERFWKNRDRVDWTQSTAPLIEAAKADGEAGLAAYATFRRALSADDIDVASMTVKSNASLLASLSKRGLVDEAIMAALGAGRSQLLRTMADSGWPMESTMREHAAEALVLAASAKDPGMFEQLLPLAPSDGALPLAQQESIARAAWKLGGPQMLAKFDRQIGGVAPAALESCRDIFSGIEGEKAFSALALAAIAREETRSRALDKQAERQERRKAIFKLANSHWSSFGEEQKMSAAVGIAAWNEPGFWTRAEERLGSQASGAASPDGPEAFYAYCFANRAATRAVFAASKEESSRQLAPAAQMAAAASNDAELASASTVDAGVPSSEEAILRAARLDHGNALKSLLARVEGATMKGLLSRALIPPADRKAAFLDPECPGFELPASSCSALADAGATFAAKDLEGEGGAMLSGLATRAAAGKISAERERAYSTLALRGAIPASAWMAKSDIVAREPQLLAMATEADRNDAEIVCFAVAKDGMALRFAGPLAKATLSAASAACSQTSDAVHCVHPSLASALSLNEANCAEKLSKAFADSKSINPLKMLAKKAALTAEKAAQDQARSELQSSAKARALDFLPLERAIADAKLRDPERGLAEMALTRAKGIRAAFEKSGSVSNLDLADLRRVVEKNLPGLINTYAATDPAERDKYDGDTRATPNKLLRSGLADGLTVMEGIATRADDGARIGLQGESLVLSGKAQSTAINQQRRADEGIAAQAEDSGQERKALDSFGEAVDGAVSAVAEASAQLPGADAQRARQPGFPGNREII